MKKGVFPGSFDPPTIAHVAIAEAARDAADLDRVDFAISRRTLGKGEHHASVESRVDTLLRLAKTRPWLGVVVTDAQLIADIAEGYDAVVIGADKWAQVRDAAWYETEAARDAALDRLPRVFVAPRSGYDVEGAEVLDIDPALGDVSSTLVRGGRRDLVAPEARGRRVIVDAMNVLGSRPDGWWRDRNGAARRLVDEIREWSRHTGDRVAVVLDGRPLPDLPEGVHDGLLIAYATRGGRNAADDRIVEEVECDRDPGSLTVVTSDHELRRRVEALGARVEGAGSLLSALERERP